MSFREYEEGAAKTAVYPHEYHAVYPALGLAGEAGEVAEKVKKVIRDKGGVFMSSDIDGIKKEIGDVLWYLTALSHDLGFTLEQAAQLNNEKLRDRQARGVIGGSGDNR